VSLFLALALAGQTQSDPELCRSIISELKTVTVRHALGLILQPLGGDASRSRTARSSPLFSREPPRD
jgi:hypothetical protein